MSAHRSMANSLDATHGFLRELARAAPTVPAELAQARARFLAEINRDNALRTLLLLGAFIALGFGLEGLFRWLASGLRRRMNALSPDAVSDRLSAVGMRCAYGLGVLLAFALGSIGAFLLFDWPPLLKHFVLAYLLVFLIVRLTLVLGGIILAPAEERFRIAPMATAAARFWLVWSAILVGYYFFVRLSLGLLTALGLSRPAGYLVGVTCAIVLLGLALYVVWRCPTWDGLDRVSRRHRPGATLISVYIVAVWLLLFTGSPTPFHVGVILLLLPVAIYINHRAVSHLLRPASGGSGADAAPSIASVVLERGLRAALLIGGAFLLAGTLGFDLDSLAARDTLYMRLLYGALNAVVIALLADFVWRVAKAVIDRKVAQTREAEVSDAEEMRRRARMRTLLPILRNVLFIVLMAVAAMMVLSAMGVEIGPLIAGAGVVGVAVGFGAQTLVKDVISGMFYLLDDAFRVGEYVQSGAYKGTVESFSLRSVKLRHHRGPLYTVPFGELGAIQNMSRDWVIDKLTIGVTYDTDLDKARKLIKQIGRELAEEPDFAPNIIETLKMQGVEQFGDYAIQLRLKMTTRPGEQFVIRRKAYALIKKAFEANGISFASPTVHVSGEGSAASAASAQRSLELLRQAAPPAA